MSASRLGRHFTAGVAAMATLLLLAPVGCGPGLGAEEPSLGKETPDDGAPTEGTAPLPLPLTPGEPAAGAPDAPDDGSLSGPRPAPGPAGQGTPDGAAPGRPTPGIRLGPWSAKPCETEACRACAAATLLPASGSRLIHDATLGEGRLAGSCATDGELRTASAPERIYRLELPVPTRLTASTFGTPFDTVLYLLDGACEESRQVACSDDALGTYQSALQAELQPGTYHLVIDGYTGWDSGAFRLAVRLTPIPADP